MAGTHRQWMSMLAKVIVTESARQLATGQQTAIPVRYEDAVSGAHASLVRANL
jgi:hypothetical protein